MRGRTLMTLLVFLLFVPAVWAEPTGREIMQEQKNRHEVDSEYTESVMILSDSRDNRERRLLKEYNKDFEDGQNRSLMVFLDPADIRGTALLTWDHENAPSDQWLYLPAQGRMQRIADSSKKSYFMGTDFTYEDLEPEELDNFVYEVLRNEEVDGHACWVIEAVPASEEQKRISGYSKRHLWIRHDNYVTVRIDFFDRRERVMKTQVAHDLENIRGDLWRARTTLMDNFSREHKTVIGVQNRRINQEIEDSVFTERFILRGFHTQ